MEKISELALLRKDLEEVKGVMKKILDDFQNTGQWQSLQLARAGIEEAITLAEDSVREEAVQQFQADGNKKRTGVTIKIFKVATITDEAKARQWCIANFTPALKLDTKAFEKAAKDGTVPTELATVTEEPRAQIDTDLSAFIPAE